MASCMWALGLCVLTVWASIRDPVSIGGWRLFETRHLLEVLWYFIFGEHSLFAHKIRQNSHKSTSKLSLYAELSAVYQ